MESNTEQVICCKHHHNLFSLPVCIISNVFCRHKKNPSGKQSVALKSYKQKSHVIYEGCVCCLKNSSALWKFWNCGKQQHSIGHSTAFELCGSDFVWITQSAFETVPYSLKSQILLSTTLVLS